MAVSLACRCETSDIEAPPKLVLHFVSVSSAIRLRLL